MNRITAESDPFSSPSNPSLLKALPQLIPQIGSEVCMIYILERDLRREFSSRKRSGNASRDDCRKKGPCRLSSVNWLQRRPKCSRREGGGRDVSGTRKRHSAGTEATRMGDLLCTACSDAAGRVSRCPVCTRGWSRDEDVHSPPLRRRAAKQAVRTEGRKQDFCKVAPKICG